jgi:hypothetical protein
MGPDALRDSFESLYNCQEKKSRDIKRVIGIFVVHISEAARIQCVYNAVCRSFLTSDQPTLDVIVENSSGSVLNRKNSFWVREYGYYWKKEHEKYKNILAGLATPWIEDLEGVNVRTSIAVFREIRIILRDACTKGVDEENPPMIEDSDDCYNRMKFSERLKAGSKRSRKR